MTADRTRWREILDKALAERDRLTPEEVEYLLELHAPEALEALFAAAYAMKIRHVGKIVRLRGLIEIGNICTKNCFYCGIRRDNTAECRFVLTRDEILEAARKILDFGYGSVVLQAGERNDRPWVDFITEVVAAIKALDGGALGITLSLGEQEEAVYRRWFEAGAHRYLLRIESSNPALYARFHPADGKHEFASRLEALEALRRVGYQLGTGVMSGLPGQSAADLAGDIEFFRQIDADMIGMGPYLPHHATPLGQTVLEAGGCDPARQLEIGLKMIAVTRLALRDVNIASTTALQALAPDGRERGLLAGANVVMPNVTPPPTVPIISFTTASPAAMKMPKPAGWRWNAPSPPSAKPSACANGAIRPMPGNGIKTPRTIGYLCRSNEYGSSNSVRRRMRRQHQCRNHASGRRIHPEARFCACAGGDSGR